MSPGSKYTSQIESKQAMFCFLSNFCHLKCDLIMEVIAHGENPVGTVWFHTCFSSNTYILLICRL